MKVGDTSNTGAHLHVWMWLKIGLMSFGGPAAHIALIQTEVCERQKLASQDSFLRGLNFAMLLPGPEAQQLATYLGWRIGGIPGGLVAGLGFVIPGAIFMIAATLAVHESGDVPLVDAVFRGVQPVVVAFVAFALVNIARRALTGSAAIAMAVAAFIAGQFFGVSFPMIALGAAVISLVLMPRGRNRIEEIGENRAPAPGDKRRAVSILATGIGLWLAVTGLCVFALPVEPFTGIARLITTAALVTFGGAYAVIAYVGEQAAGVLGWITKTDVLDGLAIAETIPGPLVLFNTYVATMAGFKAGVWGAVTGGLLAVFYTFLPSLAVVLAGAPFVERLYAIGPVRSALSGVSAAVVGAIAKLALFLFLAVCLPSGAPDWTNIAITAIAALAIWSGKVPALILILAGALAGILLY
jgi:chromate transporter